MNVISKISFLVFTANYTALHLLRTHAPIHAIVRDFFTRTFLFLDPPDLKIKTFCNVFFFKVLHCGTT